MTDARSILVDPEAELPKSDNPEGAATEDSVNEPETVETPQPAAEDEFVLEGKYEGKSIQEIVEMHQNAELALGAKNDELGQWRQLATERRQDEQATLDAAESESVELTSDALFDDPDGSVRAIIREELRSEIAPVKEELELDSAERAMTQFTTNHPDAAQVAQSAEFQAWARRSQYRANRSNLAANGDLGAANELLTEFKADNAVTSAVETPAPVVVEDTSNVDAARAAATETGGTSGPVENKPTYTAVQLTKMVNQDFAAYSDPAFQAELALAIKEGRVSGL